MVVFGTTAFNQLAPDRKPGPVARRSFCSQYAQQLLAGNNQNLVGAPLPVNLILNFIVVTPSFSKSHGISDEIGRTKEILLIDDDPSMQILVRELLENIGVRVWSAICVAEALRILDYGRFDLVLLDLALPDIPGEDALELIHVAKPSQVVVVFTQMFIDFEEQNNLLLRGAAAVLEKAACIRNLPQTLGPFLA